MAMVSRLWSISSLAVELDMDRRTVAKHLDGIPPDGELRGNPAWRLQTALDAINGTGKKIRQHRHPWAEHFTCRVRDWEEIRLEHEPIDWSLAEASERMDIPQERLLHWLRAGMAFRREGDWRTGEGFIIRPSAAIDWEILMRALSIAIDDPAFAREMGIKVDR